MGKPEEYVEGYLVNECKKEGYICWKLVCPSTSGVPDRLVAGNGHVLFVEAKRPGAKPRKLQEKRIQQMRDAGCDVRILDTRDGVDELIDYMVDDVNMLKRGKSVLVLDEKQTDLLRMGMHYAKEGDFDTLDDFGRVLFAKIRDGETAIYLQPSTSECDSGKTRIVYGKPCSFDEI